MNTFHHVENCHDFAAVDLSITLDEYVFEMIDEECKEKRTELYNKYLKYNRLREFYSSAGNLNWDYPLDWQRLEDEGYLSKRDREWFAEQLKDVVENPKWEKFRNNENLEK